MRIFGCSSPKPGTGRPQYVWSAKARRLTKATSSRQATSRGQARHTLTSALSSGIARAVVASAATAAASMATGVLDVAGSPGQPVPGATAMLAILCRDFLGTTAPRRGSVPA